MIKYHETHDYDELLSDLLLNEPALAYISEADIAVGVVASTVEKKKDGGQIVVKADCRKVPAYWQMFTPYDFLVTVYEPNCQGMTEKQLRILFLHELLHIGVNPKDPLKTFVRDHDLQDFRFVVDRYGVDWDKLGWSEVDGEA